MSLNGTSFATVFEPLSVSQRRGALIVAMFALLSALALAFMAFRTIRLAIMLFLERDSGTSRPPEILFFRTQLGHYAGCLMLSNMFISAAGLIDFSWVSRSGLSLGSMCSAQAVLMQIGIWGTCWFTVAHGVHTLSSLGFRMRPARWRSSVSAALGWSIACVAAMGPLWMSNVYGPIETSCGIMPSYPMERFVLEALPIILTALVSIALYSVIFFVLDGKLGGNSTRKLRSLNLNNRRGEDSSEEYYKFISMIIRTMFWFPFAFVLLLLPFCATHILMYAGYPVPSAASVFTDVCVSMLGLVNVILLFNTFRVISPVYHGPRATKIDAETVKTFGQDASSESPITPQPKFYSRSTLPSYGSNHRTYNSIQLSSNRSGIPSSAGVNQTTGLFNAEKAPTWTKVAPPASSGVAPPAEIQDEKCPIQPIAGTDTLGKEAQEPALKPQALPTMNHSHFSLPRAEVTTQSLASVGESNSRPSSYSSYSPTMTLSTDGGSDYSGEIMHACRVRPLPQAPEPSYDGRNTARRSHARSSMSSVWSQETASARSHSPDVESQEGYWQMVTVGHS